MKYKVLIDGEERIVCRDLKDTSRETDNIEREAIIRHFLDEEGAKDVLIIEVIKENE